MSDSPAKPRRSFTLPLVMLVVGVGGAFAALKTEPGRSMLGIVPAASAASPQDAPVEFGEFVELEPVVVNPRGSEGHRYMMLKVGVEAKDTKTLERLDVLKPAATDAVIALVSARTAAQLDDLSLRDSLKESIRTRFNEMLGKDGEITRVYFTQYVLQ